MSSEPDGPPRWPVTLLTGMLGSGKTTLLRHILLDPAMRGTAVFINEIGEIGIDHHLIERIDGETVLMRSGCLCCTMRADLPQSLNALRRRWVGDDRLDLRRVLIETTGLAVPGPILRELATNPLVAGDFPLSSVVATVDAQHALHQTHTREEARQQIAVADLVVLTKTDLASETTTAAVRAEVSGLNPHAPVIAVTSGVVDAKRLMIADDDRKKDFGAWADVDGVPDRLRHAPHAHNGIGTLSLEARDPVAWAALTAFLSGLVGEFAPSLLRFKGILNVVGSDLPVVVHGVHDAFYPAETLAAWPTEDHNSRLVIILDHMAQQRENLARLIGSSGIDWSIAG